MISLDGVHARQRPGTTRQRHTLLRSATLAALVFAAAAHANPRVAEFSLACADGDTTVAFIELAGPPAEVMSPSTGLRILGRDGQTLDNLPVVFSTLQGVSWLQGDRHFLIATPAAGERFRYPGESPRDFPNNTMPVSPDAVAGSFILYKLNGTTETTLDRVDYGPGRAVIAPPPGTSIERSGSSWRFQPGPELNYFYSPISNPGRTDGCYGFMHFFVTQLALACEDGDTRGQFLELTLIGPHPALDARVHLKLYDHTGALLTDMAVPFGARTGETVAEGTRWLFGGPAYAPPETTPADAALPVALDPVGGRIELSGTFYATPLVFDGFTYGIAGAPTLAPGTAYERTPGGGSVRVTTPQPHNSLGQLVQVPLCALGSSPAALVIGELALACMDGSPGGQFVEITASGTGVPILSTDRLRAYGRDGGLRFELAHAFGWKAGQNLLRTETFSFAPAGSAMAPRCDGVLPDTLDRVAGRLEIVRSAALGDTVMASLAWGDAPLPLPPPGSSLVGDAAGVRLNTYPSPRNYAGAALTLPACHLQPGPRRLQVDEIGLACVDGSRDGMYFVLGGLDTLLVRDRTLGLRLVGAGGAEQARVLPLFPPRESWPALAARSWLLAGPAFAARAGGAPDGVFGTVPLEPPVQLELFRRDPVSAVESTLGAVSVPNQLLDAGHAALRTPEGDYERAARPTPRTFDGTTLVPAACWLQPHPEEAEIHSLFLRCRDGDPAGQYVELAATSPESDFAPELVLRVFDRAGRLLGERAAPYPAPRMGRIWPADLHVLLGGPGFAARFGTAPDAQLPAVLDTVAGRIELLLDTPGIADVLLDQISYGIPGAPAPAAGASLERSPLGFVQNALPAPSGVTAHFTSPTTCLGECPPRTVQFALGGVQALAGDSVSVVDVGTQFDYFTGGGAFRLESQFHEITVRWSDQFRVEGPPLGEPLDFTARVRTILASADSCRSGRCFSSLASVALASAAGADSAAAKPDPRRVLGVPVRVRSGETFALDLSMRANAQLSPTLPASVQARLEFAGLPPGSRVVSCHGFDTRAQRSIGVPEVLAEPRQVTVRWPVTGPQGFSVLVERSVDDGEWEPFETRAPDADGMLRVVDRRVLPEHRYRYRAGWSDEFDSYVGPEALAEPQRQPGFDFAGVRPNPSHGTFAVALELPEASEVRFDVMDVAGRVVVARSRWLTAGAHLVPLASERTLAPGLYVVRLRYRGLVVRRTAIVLR